MPFLQLDLWPLVRKNSRTMNKLLAATVIGFFLTANFATARLGETAEECRGRYGQEVDKRPASIAASDPDALLFSKNSISILIEFKSGIAWRMMFRKINLTDEELVELLEANAPAGGWSPSHKVGSQEFRISLDRRRTAAFTPPAKNKSEPAVLEIASRDYGNANRAEQVDKIAEAVLAAKNRKAGTGLNGF